MELKVVNYSPPLRYLTFFGFLSSGYRVPIQSFFFAFLVRAVKISLTSKSIPGVHSKLHKFATVRFLNSI
jgi:hypothetical protein